MRTIREMLGNDEKVWIYINGEDTWKMFVNMAVTEGFHFGELPAEKWAFGHAVAVHSNGKMGHLPLFVWCLSFQKGAVNCQQKVDFRRYIERADDYKCRDSHFLSRIISSQNSKMY